MISDWNRNTNKQTYYIQLSCFYTIKIAKLYKISKLISVSSFIGNPPNHTLILILTKSGKMVVKCTSIHSYALLHMLHYQLGVLSPPRTIFQNMFFITILGSGSAQGSLIFNNCETHALGAKCSENGWEILRCKLRQIPPKIVRWVAIG